jgi:NaMN:DMB phosphoribosyltransferase
MSVPTRSFGTAADTLDVIEDLGGPLCRVSLGLMGAAIRLGDGFTGALAAVAAAIGVVAPALTGRRYVHSEERQSDEALEGIVEAPLPGLTGRLAHSSAGTAATVVMLVLPSVPRSP